MDISRNTPVTSGRFVKIGLVLALSFALTLSLAGCSGGAEEETEGSADQSPQSSQEAAETTGTTEATSGAGSTADAPETTSATNEQSAAPDDSGDSGGVTALSGGIEAARSEAESWNADAELYGIASVPATVNAEGENSGWLYSFVSESAGAVISVPYSEGRVQRAQGQELPRSQIRRIAGDTLPVGELVDSPEAMRRSDEVRSYLQENPDAGASAGLDSGSSEEPEWILTVTAGEPIQERLPATE